MVPVQFSRILLLYIILNVLQLSDASINLNVAKPTQFPSASPSLTPTDQPSVSPSTSKKPSFKPSSATPTKTPTSAPSVKPSAQPSHSPTDAATSAPTPSPPPTVSPVPTEDPLPLIAGFDLPDTLCLYLPLPYIFCYLFGEGKDDRNVVQDSVEKDLVEEDTTSTLLTLAADAASGVLGDLTQSLTGEAGGS